MDADDLIRVPLVRVTLTGDLEGATPLLQRDSSGQLLLVADTPRLAALEAKCSTPAEIAHRLGVALLSE